MVGDVKLVLLKKDVSREVAGADKLWPFRSSHAYDYRSEGDVIVHRLRPFVRAWGVSPV